MSDTSSFNYKIAKEGLIVDSNGNIFVLYTDSSTADMYIRLFRRALDRIEWTVKVSKRRADSIKFDQTTYSLYTLSNYYN